MTPSALLLACALTAWAQEPVEPVDVAPTVDPLSPYRTDLDDLAERTIGTTSKPVAFNWRRTNVHLAGMGSLPFELNNFATLRGGALVRLPSRQAVVELGLSYAHVWDTPSSDLLAFTPFRQPGRPDRFEIDAGAAFPLAEGVVTTFPRFFPAVELVFNFQASFRYLLYPGGFPGMKVGKVMTALLAPQLTEDELVNLEDRRLLAMQIDPARYGLLVGLGNDVYFEQGLFLTPRMMMALPLLAPATGTELLVWGEFSLAVGIAL